MNCFSCHSFLCQNDAFFKNKTKLKCKKLICVYFSQRFCSFSYLNETRGFFKKLVCYLTKAGVESYYYFSIM